MYHVTSRGDRREPIYRDDRDRDVQLGVIAHAMDRFDAGVLAYCLMGNHYHLVLHTRQANLSRLMRHVNGVYTQAFNRRHGLVGHLFQGRFKAILVDQEAYLLTLCRYVERNPVAAGLVSAAVDWQWSSCRPHVGLARAPEWLQVDDMQGQLLGRPVRRSADRRKAERLYAQWVSEDEVDSFSWQEALRQQIFLGDERFAERMQSHVATTQRASVDIPKQQRMKATTWKSCLKQSGNRDEAIRLAYREAGMTMTAIAKELGLSVSRVSRVIAAEEAKGKT